MLYSEMKFTLKRVDKNGNTTHAKYASLVSIMTAFEKAMKSGLYLQLTAAYEKEVFKNWYTNSDGSTTSWVKA